MVSVDIPEKEESACLTRGHSGHGYHPETVSDRCCLPPAGLRGLLNCFSQVLVRVLGRWNVEDDGVQNGPGF